ncbi:MAG: MarR family transcriptional regulator [Firmicutes bacterium]|nr:MarR family transcriptional regulator [Bacillota bacterium]
MEGKEERATIPLDDALLLTTAKLFCSALIVAVTGPALEEIAKLALTDVQFAALRYIFLHDPPAASELAEGLGISGAAVTKLADRLERKGLIARKPDPGDRRTLRLVLTDEGRSITEDIMRREQGRFDEILERMPASSREALECGMKDFLKASLTSPKDIERICLRCGWAHQPNCPGSRIYESLTGKTVSRV